MKIPTTALALRDIDVLFRPFEHRKINLHTRLVMAPIPRLFSDDGVPTIEMKRYYSRRAGHDVGLIISEPVSVNETGGVDEGMAHFYGGRALREWKGILRAVHISGCKMAPLLTHAGMLHPGDSAAGPSGIEPVSLLKRADAMSRESIRTVISDFARAAAAARLMGFDAVAIDGAGRGLIEQFLRLETNHRHDEYGGDAISRGRFASEVLHAVRKAVGSRLPVIFRLPGQCAGSPQELEHLVRMLCDAGADIFACVSEHVHLPAFAGSPLNMACWVRMLSGRPVIAEGGVGLRTDSLQRLACCIAAREFDLVAVGRALLADAEWGSKIRLGNEGMIHPYSSKALMHLF